MIENGCTETQINFVSSLTNVSANPLSPADGSCNLFDLTGGKVTQALFTAAVDPVRGPTFFANTSLSGGVFYPNNYNALAGVGTANTDLIVIVYAISPSVCVKINQLVGFNSPTFAATTANFYIMRGFNGTYPTSGMGTPVGFSNSTLEGCYYDAQYGGEYSYVRVLLSR